MQISIPGKDESARFDPLHVQIPLFVYSSGTHLIHDDLHASVTGLERVVG